MSCKCHKPKWNEFGTPPNAVCIFCAEKHLALALTLHDEANPAARRVQVLGELECARRHLGSGYPELLDGLVSCMKGYMTTCSLSMDELRSLADMASDKVLELGTGEDRHTRLVNMPYTALGKPGAPFICELALAAALELMGETGYERANRHLVIGNLIIAQMCAAGHDQKTAMAIREHRHVYQTTGRLKDPTAFESLVRGVSDDVMAHLEEYAGTYGTDFSWHLEK